MNRLFGLAILAFMVPWLGWGVCFHHSISMKTYQRWRIATYVVGLTEIIGAILAFAIWLVMGGAG